MRVRRHPAAFARLEEERGSAGAPERRAGGVPMRRRGGGWKTFTGKRLPQTDLRKTFTGKRFPQPRSKGKTLTGKRLPWLLGVRRRAWRGWALKPLHPTAAAAPPPVATATG